MKLALGMSLPSSNKGGLTETITDGIILQNLNSDEIYKKIKELIINKIKLKKIHFKIFIWIINILQKKLIIIES